MLDLKRVEDGLDVFPEYICKSRLVEQDNLATLLAMIALSAVQSSTRALLTMLFCHRQVNRAWHKVLSLNGKPCVAITASNVFWIC